MKANKNNETREQLTATAISAYMELFVMMQSASVNHWLMFELTFAQVRALFQLAVHKAVSVSQLARLLGVGKPTASILVQQLVERGLVTRTEHETDRRQTVLRLSERGAEIGAGRRSEREKQWQGWLSHLSDEELSGLARGLDALQRVVRAEAQPASDSTSAEDETQ
jgi:DNA-binding MarR family transcriptional regulator